MSNPTPSAGLILGGSLATSQVDSSTNLRPLGSDVMSLLGLQRQPEIDERRYPFGRFVETLNAGIGVGVLDPLHFIGPIGRYVDSLREHAHEAGGGRTAENIGYGLGFLTGFLIPAGVAGKAATYGVRGIDAALGGARLLRAADAGMELTRAGVLTQGAIAGSLLAAGAPVEENSTRVGNVARAAVIGGVGDVVLQSVWRMVSGASILSREVPASIRRATSEASEQGIETAESAVTMGRAAQLIDDLIRPTNPVGDHIGDSIEFRKLNLRLGLDELGLSELEPGQLRIVPSFGGNLDETRAILNNIPGLAYATATRRTAAGTVVHDVLLGPAEQINRDVIQTFQKHGFIPGQEAIWQGKRFILETPSKNPNYVMGIAADATAKSTPIPRSEMLLGSLVNEGYKTTKLADPNAQWLDFVREHGPFPFRFTGEQEFKGFDGAFEEFTSARNFTPAARQQLKLYFLKRQNALLADVDNGELTQILQNVTGARVKDIPHPEGTVEELAAQRGLSVTRVALSPAKKGAKARWGKVLIDIDSGQAHGPFKTPAMAKEFLLNYDRRMVRIDPDGPLAEGATGLPAKGANVTQLINQAELSNASIPWSVILFGRVTPYLHFVRRVNDSLVREMGEAAPDIYGSYSQLLQDMARHRTEMSPWLDRLTKIRGGGLFRSSKVRIEQMENIAELLESGAPGSSAWNSMAATHGLSAVEQDVARNLRTYYNDIFKVAEEAGNIDITADDFIENYMPHIMRRGHNNWVQSYTKMHGAPPSAKVRAFVHEFERTGELTNYEKDPFAVAYRYTDALFFKKHVSENWSSLLKQVQDIPEQQAGNLQPNYGLVQLKQTLLDQLAMLRGNATATDYTTRAAMQSLSKQLNLHLDDKTIDRTISTLIAANYGAFMGWRPALAVRNASQIFMTAMPLIGAKYTGVGIRRAVERGMSQEMLEMGVIAKGQYALPFQDALYYDTVRRGVMSAEHGATASKAAARVGKIIRYGTQKSLYMQNATDEFTRGVAYYGAKQRMLDAMNDWATKDWTQEQFNARSGLSAMGPTVTRGFHAQLPKENPVQAAKWYAAQLTNDAMFVYQQGAGPMAFNTRAGKLFGMYGTWPSWYGSLIKNRLTHGTPLDKARFVGYTAAVHMAFLNSVYLTGINMSKWTGLQFGWAGGPAFDVVKDLSDIIEGETAEGGATPERELALSKYGLRDTGAAVFELRDPRKLIEGTAGLFFPGTYVARDLERAVENQNPLQALGFQTQ